MLGLTKNFKYDAIAVAMPVGLAFLAATVTGSIWGRIIWGIWWTWDARLTSAGVLAAVCRLPDAQARH
jgi:heme exporter protein C